jgi:hypothetical protein
MTNANTLDKVLSLTPVTFNWNSEDDTTSKHIGFIAQEVEQVFPELVQTDPVTGLKTLSYTNLTPYLVKAIEEMDLKMKNINDLNLPNTWRDSLLAWFKDTSNGITEFVASILRAKDQMCIGEGSDEVCITKDDLIQMKSNSGVNNNQNQTAAAAGAGDSGSTETVNPVTETDTTTGATTDGNATVDKDNITAESADTTTDPSINTPGTGATNGNANSDATTNTDMTNTNNEPSTP